MSSGRPVSISVTKEGVKLSQENSKKFDAITKQDIDGQAKSFLKAYMREYLEKVEEILSIAEDFKQALPKSVFEIVEGVEPCYEMDEVTAHKFLEKNGETMTVRELRSAIADIDLNKNFKVGLIEFLLFKYGKDIESMLEGLENSQSNPQLEIALENAIAECMKVLAEKKAKEAEMSRLVAVAEKGGVKGMAAKATIAQILAGDKLEENRREIQAAANQRKAKKMLDEGAGDAVEDALKQAKKEKEEAAKKKKEESRAKLAARAAMFSK